MRRWGTRMPIALGKRSVSRGGCRAPGISPRGMWPSGEVAGSLLPVPGLSPSLGAPPRPALSQTCLSA